MMQRKMGSMVRDLVKPLEKKLIQFLSAEENRIRARLDRKNPALRNIHYSDRELDIALIVRRNIHLIAEETIAHALKHDLIFCEYPFSFDERHGGSLRVDFTKNSTWSIFFFVRYMETST